MKVRELIEKLSDFNENLEVLVSDYEKIDDEDEPVFYEIDGVE